MRIRMLRAIQTAKGKIEVGTILDITPKVAMRWITEGDAAHVGKTEASENKVIRLSGSENKETDQED